MITEFAMKYLLFINQCYVVFMCIFLICGPLMGFGFASKTKEFKNCVKLFCCLLIIQILVICISAFISEIFFRQKFMRVFLDWLLCR